MTTTARHILIVLALTCTAVGAAEKSPGLPATPDGTVTAVAAAVADHHPEILWQAMPASWRDDVVALTREGAAAADPAAYDGMFKLSRRAIRIARAKKPLLLEMSVVDALGKDRAEVGQGFDHALDLLEVLATSEISTHEGLRELDWPTFLRSTGGALLAKVEAMTEGSDEPSPLAPLRTIEVETVSSDGDSAAVRIEVEGEEPRTVPMTRVEGRWVPTDLATDWDANVEQARSTLAEQDETARAEATNQMMMVLATANAVLDQVEAATTVEELESVVGGLIASLGGALTLGVTKEMSPTAPPASGE